MFGSMKIKWQPNNNWKNEHVWPHEHVNETNEKEQEKNNEKTETDIQMEKKRVMIFLIICVWGTFPCYLLHFGAKISDLHAICFILEPKSLICLLFAAFWS